MLFAKSAIALLAAASSALAIAIDTPSASSFWVQNTSNTISWSFSSSDPNPIDIVVTNSNSSILNGNFSIARFVDLSNGTFTVTNVTLTVGTGYVVNFVNTSNSEQVFAQSGAFDVKEPGTTPASVSSASATATSASGTNSGATSSASGTATDASSTSSAALRAVSLNLPAFPIFVSAGMALAGSLLVL